MNTSTTLEGSYSFVRGRLEPDHGMRQIVQKLKGLKMLAGSTETTQGEFYYDPAENSYWHYVQEEDYSARLLRTTRADIQTKYPHINCDKLIEVPR